MCCMVMFVFIRDCSEGSHGAKPVGTREEKIFLLPKNIAQTVDIT